MALITILPAAFVVNALVTLNPGEDAVPESLTVIAPAPLKVRAPIVSFVVPPLPLVILSVERSATFTVLIVPVPSTVPWFKVTVGETAVVVLTTNLAPLPLRVIPLLPLIAPVLLKMRDPPLMVVAPE